MKTLRVRVQIERYGSEDAVIDAAIEILRAKYAKRMDIMSEPARVREYMTLNLSGLEHEVFYIVYLTAQNGVIAAEELFRGTLTQTSVYPREVVKRALGHNAAGVILCHNHPSGVAEPSGADKAITCTLRQALALVDVRVLDHILVAGATSISFSERGIL